MEKVPRVKEVKTKPSLEIPVTSTGNHNYTLINKRPADTNGCTMLLLKPDSLYTVVFLPCFNVLPIKYTKL